MNENELRAKGRKKDENCFSLGKIEASLEMLIEVEFFRSSIN